MAKKGAGRQSGVTKILKHCECIANGTHKCPVDKTLNELVKCVKEFFGKRYNLKQNFSVNDIEPKAKFDPEITESQREEIIMFLDELSLIYFSGISRTKDDVIKKAKEFRSIVINLTAKRRVLKAKKKESKAKELLKDIKLKAYHREIRPIVSLIIKSYDLMKEKNLNDAKKVYDKVYSKYSILPIAQKKQIYEKIRILEEEIFERYYEKKRIELENSFDKAFHLLSKKQVHDAEREVKNIDKIIEDLPEKMKEKYVKMDSQVIEKLKTVKTQVRIDKVNHILDEVYDKGKNYSKKEIISKYKQALEYFKLLNNDDKAKLFDAMKRIKRKNDEAYMESVCEKIAQMSVNYWNIHKIEERKANSLYEEAHQIYLQAEKNQKKEFYEMLNNSYNMLVEALIDKKMRELDKGLKSKKGKDKKHHLMEKYVETKELYDLLPDYKKKRFYSVIFEIYNQISEL